MLQYTNLVTQSDKLAMSDNDPLKKGIKRAIECIEKDCQAGEHIKPNSPIMKHYIKKLTAMGVKINNIRVYDLPQAYRLIYTIISNPTEVKVVVSMILDYLDHTKYDRLTK